MTQRGHVRFWSEAIQLITSAELYMERSWLEPSNDSSTVIISEILEKGRDATLGQFSLNHVKIPSVDFRGFKKNAWEMSKDYRRGYLWHRGGPAVIFPS